MVASSKLATIEIKISQKAKLKRRIELIDETIEKYLSWISSADREEEAFADATKQRLESKIDKLKKEIERLNEIEKQMLESPDKQISLTDP